MSAIDPSLAAVGSHLGASRPPRRRPRLRDAAPWIWIAPAAAVIVFVQLGPMAYGVWLSLHEKKSVLPMGAFVGFENYLAQLSSPDFWSSVGIGAGYSAVTVAIQTVLGLAIALLLNSNVGRGRVVRAIAILPMLVPTAVAALIFTFGLHNLHGPINHLLVDLDVIEQPILFLGDPNWVYVAVVGVATWLWMPFIIVTFLARLQSIDPSLSEAAQVSGAGALRCLLDVTLPALRATIALVVLLRTIWTFNTFDIPYLLTYGGPAGATETLPIYTYRINFLEFDQGTGAALAVLMFVLLLLFAIPYFLIFKPEREVEVD